MYYNNEYTIICNMYTYCRRQAGVRDAPGRDSGTQDRLRAAPPMPPSGGMTTATTTRGDGGCSRPATTAQTMPKCCACHTKSTPYQKV